MRWKTQKSTRALREAARSRPHEVAAVQRVVAVGVGELLLQRGVHHQQRLQHLDRQAPRVARVGDAAWKRVRETTWRGCPAASGSRGESRRWWCTRQARPEWDPETL